VSRSAFPYWSEKELDRLRQQSRQQFVERYSTAVQTAYREILADCRKQVEQLLAETDNLRGLKKGGSVLDARRDLLDAARYCASPVISADTMRIVSEREGAEGTILLFLDGERFPWVGDGRNAKPAECRQAVAMTAKLWADQRAKTADRTSYSKAQERRTREALEAAGLAYVSRQEIRDRLKEAGDDPGEGLTASNWGDALHRGEFTDEIKLAGNKCDVPARLAGGQLLPIECKVSNSEVNSTKRLIRETLGKHIDWRRTFGGELATGAVLAGVFSMRNLQQAQGQGMLLFFEHRLNSLTAFVKAGAQPRG
jgi:XamI restriction endonuclease